MKINGILKLIPALMIIFIISCSSGNEYEPSQPTPEQNKSEDETEESENKGNVFSPYTEIELDSNVRKISSLNNDFAFKLYEKAIESNDNFVISPFSVFCTLGIMANGDEGDCRNEIAHLILSDSHETDITALNMFAKTMIAELPKVDLNSKCFSCNSIWHINGQELKQEFISALTEYYSAERHYINLKDQDPSYSINSWIESKTEGQIKTLIDAGTEVRTAIVNTLFLKAGWSDFKFDAALTALEPFHNADNTYSYANIMHTTVFKYYLDNDRFHGIDIPLGNGNFSITLLMTGSSDENTVITAEEFRSLIDSGKLCKIELGVPKFEIQFKEDIRTSLIDFGLIKTFNSGLNSVLMDKSLFKINLFLHGASLTIDENGIVGSSASVVGVAGGDDSEPEIMTLTFNKPFIYIIRETSTNTILFIGRQIKY